ncbi:FtsX-like permease family protein [Nonomuraea spiralis]|uniref:ABC transporter permease n=1 Tax=Nonomuraea spiralis TaxID=46182 RepID=UPI003789BFBF
MSAFIAALRISRRDALRFKGRSALIMVMIGLPILVITGVLTGAATTSLTPQERAVTRMGAADARLITFPSRAQVEQDYTDDSAGQPESTGSTRPWTTAEINTLLPGRLLRYQSSQVNARLPDGYYWTDVMEVDLRDPMTAGMRTLTQGRYAAAPGEVAISPEMADKGVRVGDTITVRRPDRTVKVVGVVENPNRPGMLELVALPEGLLKHQNDGNSSGWLADTTGPVTWAKVRELNKVGLGVTSRAVVDAHAGDDRYASGAMRTTRDLVQLGVAIVLVVLETVLLAGPAFAVSLRRRRRELAMIAAQGGSARHLRMIVLADGLVLGGAAALLGVVLGIGPGLLVESIAARELDWTHGPAEVPWLPVLGVAVLGLVSGLIAAIVPAVQASRQNTAQVLAGRAAEVRGRARRPVAGIVLLLVGLGATGFAMTRGVVSMTAAFVPFVFGMVALMPWLVQASARIAARLPLPLRLSVRDAARHRVRTASAAAAVMAATMGAVALGIGTSSGYAHQEQADVSAYPAGTTVIGGATAMDGPTWTRLKEAVRARFPGTEVVAGREPTDAKGRTLALEVTLQCTKECPQRFYYRPPIGDADLLAFLQKRRDPQAAAALAAGKAVAFSQDVMRDGMIELVVNDRDSDTLKEMRKIRIPAVVSSGADSQQTSALIPPQALARAGLGSVERMLYAGALPQDEQRMEADLRGEVNGDLYVGVEKGKGESRAFALLLLLGAALVLVLGGTFAATGLAAADMRPDLNNLSAVGAAPRVRRLVVAAQAAYIAGLGAVVGLVAGSVAGVALTWPMTSVGASGVNRLLEGPGTIDVPWLFLATVVLGLPLVAALVAGLFTRTRLVLARRVA